MTTKTTKGEALRLWLAGTSPEGIAERLSVDIELVAAWRDEGCWEAARDLADAQAKLSGDGSEEETDRAHAILVGAIERMLVTFTQLISEARARTPKDLKEAAEAGEHVLKGVKYVRALQKDIKECRRDRELRARLGHHAA